MARRAFAPRRNLKDQVAANQRQMAAFSPDGKAPPLPASLEYLGEPERVIKHKSEKEELEGSVLKEVGEIILLSPNVVLAWRVNGGAAQAEDGIFRIWFYRWIKRPSKEMTLPDFLCVLRSGKLAALEAKKRAWKFTGTDREKAQKSFIDAIISRGGVGGFVTCAEDAQRILNGG